MPYTLQGYDTFEGGEAWYPLDGEFTTIGDAYAAAYARFTELDKSQPGAGGIQDQVWLVYEDGRKRQLTKLGILRWAQGEINAALPPGEEPTNNRL